MGKTPHKLLIIGTSGLDNDVLDLAGIAPAFNNSIQVPYLTSGSEILTLLQESNASYHFSNDETEVLQARLTGKRSAHATGSSVN